MGFLDHVLGSAPLPAPARPTLVLSRVPPEERARLAPRHAALLAALRAAGAQPLEANSVYDLQPEDAAAEGLRAIAGDLVYLGWHYPRAIKWILARQGLEVNGATRKLHCIDAREKTPEALAAWACEILAGQASAEVKPLPGAQGVGQLPLPGVPEQTPRARGLAAEQELAAPANAALSPRWYPVIDYDACTNCMECLDFCLFGVYGVDHAGTLRTVQQDQCRQDCPACSRVCPVGAIVFPKYQTNQAIAGAPDGGDRGSLKLDLSKIFGKPKARHAAALERDRELLKAGRKPAGAERVDKLAEEFDKLEL